MTRAADNDDIDISLAEVARRLIHSPRWLRDILAGDRNRNPPRLQFHHYIGRRPLWTEAETQALRAAIIAIEKERRDGRRARHRRTRRPLAHLRNSPGRGK